MLFGFIHASVLLLILFFNNILADIDGEHESKLNWEKSNPLRKVFPFNLISDHRDYSLGLNSPNDVNLRKVVHDSHNELKFCTPRSRTCLTQGECDHCDGYQCMKHPVREHKYCCATLGIPCFSNSMCCSGLCSEYQQCL